MLPEALHSIRTLICTSTNATPHERMFVHARRSTSGCSLPTFLSEPGPVLLRKFVRTSKNDPLVDRVELLEANSHYAHVRFPNGRESTVSTHDLADIGNDSNTPVQNFDNSVQDASVIPYSDVISPKNEPAATTEPESVTT